ncbi:MAG: hypothetical protein Q9222_004235 [Ikaeria aurantiellina]
MSDWESLLPYYSLNHSQPTTLLLIHGGFSSRAEFTFITPELSQYHLLIPALPRHSPNLKTGPFNLPQTSYLLSELIRSKAKSGKVHVAGISLGGSVAVHLAAHYPDLVESIFASGVFDFGTMSSFTLTVLPYFFFTATTLLGLLPASFERWLIPHEVPEGLQEDMYAARTFAAVTEFTSSMTKDQKFLPVRARTLVIGAGGSGKWYNRDFDDSDHAKTIAKRLGAEGAAVQPWVVHGVGHAWSLHKPELFAKAVEAWVEGKPLPEAFKPL